MSGKEEKRIENVPRVADFEDVVLEDLPGLPPPRQVEFWIDFQTGTTLIAKAPNRLVPSEIKELMKQIQELLEK
jgi:hypothetical protein